MTREIRSSWKMAVAGGNDATEILDARLYLSRDWTCAMPRCQYAVPSSYLSCKLPNPGNLKCQRPAINTTVPRRKCETCCQSLYRASDSVRNFCTHTHTYIIVFAWYRDKTFTVKLRGNLFENWKCYSKNILICYLLGSSNLLRIHGSS